MKRASLLWFQIVALIVSLNLLSCGGGGGGVGPTIDTSFGTKGIVTTAIGSQDDEVDALAIDSNGNLVVAGFSVGANTVFALARYTTTGALDTTFGTGGIVTTAIGSVDDEAHALAIDSNGNLIVAGYSHNGTQKVFALVRYTTTGALDTTFGTGGIVTTAIGSNDDEVNSLAIDSNGNLVAAGYSFNGSQNIFALVRYTTTGTLDTTFGTGGIVTTIPGGYDAAESVQIQTDGKLVAAGYSFIDGQNEFALIRYNTDGSLDTNFNTTGIVTTAIGTDDDAINSLAIDSNGKLVAAGASFNGNLSQYEFALARYNTDGSLDTSFNPAGTNCYCSLTGIVTTAIGSQDDEAISLAIDSNGKLVAAGFSAQGSPYPYEFALARYTTTGTLDTTFHTTGIVTTAIGTFDDEINSLAIQPSDGKLVAAGLSFINDQFEFALVRYLP